MATYDDRNEVGGGGVIERDIWGEGEYYGGRTQIAGREEGKGEEIRIG